MSDLSYESGRKSRGDSLMYEFNAYTVLIGDRRFETAARLLPKLWQFTVDHRSSRFFRQITELEHLLTDGRTGKVQ